jgi:hypothetical protein
MRPREQSFNLRINSLDVIVHLPCHLAFSLANSIPQGLKPALLGLVFGTTEVVP